MSRLAEATGRQVIYNNLGQTVRQPNGWKELMAVVDETAQAGIRAYPLCTPNSTTQRFTMRNVQVFRGSPTWHPILLASDDEKLRAYSDAAVRQKLDVLAAWLDGRDYLEQRFTAADIVMASSLKLMRHTDIIEQYPVLDAYMRRCEARPAYQRALRDHMAAYEQAVS